MFKKITKIAQNLEDMLPDMSKLAKCSCVNSSISFYSQNKTVSYIIWPLFLQRFKWFGGRGGTLSGSSHACVHIKEKCSVPCTRNWGRWEENLLAWQARSLPMACPSQQQALRQKLLARLHSYPWWLIFQVISSVKSSRITDLKKSTEISLNICQLFSSLSLL